MVQKIGRFDIIKLLGRGGMAEVYLAKDTLMDREVAIKLLPQQVLDDPQSLARFEREARVLAKLDHPNVVPIYDFGSHQGQPYMVSRHMAAGSLEQRLKTKGKLSLAEAIQILQPICAALEAAHSKGIVHRDLKPGNILFDEDQRVYVADFGIAKLAEGSAALTGTGIIGTPAYMSPEQFHGETELDARSDQYSLAIMLFEMLSGQLPFKADTLPAMMHKHLTQAPPSIRKLRSDVPDAFAQALERALSKKPDQRHKNLKAFLGALQQGVSTKIIADPLPGKTSRSKPAKTSRLVKKQVSSTSEKPRAKTTRLLRNEPSQTARGTAARRPALPRPLWLYASGAALVAFLLWQLSQQPPTASPATDVSTSVSPATTAPTIQPTQTLAPEPTSTPRPLIPTGVSYLRTLPGVLDGQVDAVAFSPDGQLLAAGGESSGVINIWSTADGELVRSLPSLESNSSLAWISSISFSQDKPLLASVGGWNDHAVNIWNLSDGSLARKLTGHAQIVTAVAFSPTSDLIASTSWDSRVRIWNASTGETVHSLIGHTDQAYAIAFSPDGQLVASGGRDQTIRIWRVEDGELLLTLNPSVESVRALTFSRDGKLLVSAGSPEIQIWHVETGELIRSIYLSSAISVALSPDGKLVAGAGVYGEAGVWRVEDGQLLGNLSAPAESISTRLHSVAFSPDGQFLATGGRKQVHLWQVNYGNE